MTNEQDRDLEPLLTAHQNQLNLVMSEADSIDGKALALLAIIVALLIFIAQAGLHINHWWQGALLIGPQCLALVSCGFAIWPKPYVGPSIDLAVHPEYLTLNKNELELQLLADADEAIKHDIRLNKIRWRYCVACIVLVLLGVVELFVIL